MLYGVLGTGWVGRLKNEHPLASNRGTVCQFFEEMGESSLRSEAAPAAASSPRGADPPAAARRREKERGGGGVRGRKAPPRRAGCQKFELTADFFENNDDYILPPIAGSGGETPGQMSIRSPRREKGVALPQYSA